MLLCRAFHTLKYFPSHFRLHGRRFAFPICIECRIPFGECVKIFRYNVRSNIAKAQILSHQNTIGHCFGGYHASSSTPIPWQSLLPVASYQLYGGQWQLLCFEWNWKQQPNERVFQYYDSIVNWYYTAFNTCIGPFSPDGEMVLERCVVVQFERL